MWIGEGKVVIRFTPEGWMSPQSEINTATYLTTHSGWRKQYNLTSNALLFKRVENSGSLNLSSHPHQSPVRNDSSRCEIGPLFLFLVLRCLIVSGLCLISSSRGKVEWWNHFCIYCLVMHRSVFSMRGYEKTLSLKRLHVFWYASTNTDYYLTEVLICPLGLRLYDCGCL